MFRSYIRTSFLCSGLFLILSTVSFLVLTSTPTSADDTIIDDVIITVPVACTLTGTGMNSHTATIDPGTTNSSIGETVLKAYCNDNGGFAIYAIGYSNQSYGNNKLLYTVNGTPEDPTSSSQNNHNISTGLNTTGNPSSWAMKLTSVSDTSINFPITIQSDTEGTFANFHTVPDTYKLVAKRTEATDVGSEAIGSILKTTYQAHIASLQKAGTYEGKVKYTLVHPNNVDAEALTDAVTVVFDGNGLTFPDGSTTNTVKYANVCEPDGSGYVGSLYRESGTQNIITPGGAQNGAYSDQEFVLENINITGADKIKVVVDYAITGDTAELTVLDKYWDGDWDNWDDEWNDAVQWIYDENNISGAKTYLVDGDTATIFADSWGTPASNYDKGFYIKVYPVYNTEQPGTTYETFLSNDCSMLPISGTYVETEPWNNKWTATINNNDIEFMATDDCYEDWCDDDNSPRGAVNYYISENYNSLKGTTLTLYAYNPVTFDIVYAAANKTKLNNYYKIQDLNPSMCSDVSLDETTTVIDVRDNKTYSIGKFQDNNCWLRESLALDPTDSTTASNMSATNTNATNDAIYNYLNGGNPNSITGWTDTAVSKSNGTILEPTITESGSYLKYNYCAVSVGTYCYPINSGAVNISGTDIDSPYDICPFNWRLPTFNEIELLAGMRYSLFYKEYLGTTDMLWTPTYLGSEQMEVVNISRNSEGATMAVSLEGYYGNRSRYNHLSARCVLPTSN